MNHEIEPPIDAKLDILPGMIRDIPPTWPVRNDIRWPESRNIRDGDIEGVLLMDVDGVLTVPGKRFAIDHGAIGANTHFIERGGSIIYATGANRFRVERGALTALFHQLEEDVGGDKARILFNERVVLMPEYCSAIFFPTRVFFKENELYFKWLRLHELHVPDKVRLREVIKNELVKLVPGSEVASDNPDDDLQREYILSWTNITGDIFDWVEYIETTFAPKHPEIRWGKIAIMSARTTIDFINADAGRTISPRWILKEFSSLRGRVVGFGDWGDEFAKIVPVFNVNLFRPNEFRIRGLAAVDISCRWELMNLGEYVVIGTSGLKEKILSRNSGEEIQVLRDENGDVIFAIEVKKKIGEETKRFLVPAIYSTEEVGPQLVYNKHKGRPVRISPFIFRDKQGNKISEIPDAGGATAMIINRLLEIGYFNKGE